MSRAIDIAQAMADRLNGHASLPDVDALVYRQKTIQSEIATKIAKVSGAVIVILYQGFTNPAANASGNVTCSRRYTVSIFSKPVLRGSGATDPDEITEIVSRLLHDWEPDEPSDSFAQISVTACDLRTDEKFLIYDLEVVALSRL